MPSGGYAVLVDEHGTPYWDEYKTVRRMLAEYGWIEEPQRSGNWHKVGTAAALKRIEALEKGRSW